MKLNKYIPYTQQQIYDAIKLGETVTANGKPITIHTDCHGDSLEFDGILATMHNPPDSTLCIDPIKGERPYFKPRVLRTEAQRKAFVRQVQNREEINISRIVDALYTIKGFIPVRLSKRFFDLEEQTNNADYDWTQGDLEYISSFFS